MQFTQNRKLLKPTYVSWEMYMRTKKFAEAQWYLWQVYKIDEVFGDVSSLRHVKVLRYFLNELWVSCKTPDICTHTAALD